MLYWDTEMFRSSQQNRQFGNEKDYKKLLKEEMLKAAEHPQDYPGHEVAKKLYARLTDRHSQATYKKVYQILIAGDPKKRTYRVVVGDLVRDLHK